MTLVTVLVGSLTDAMGLRRAFLLGVSICIVARLIMTSFATPWIVLGLGLLPLAVGEALGTPVLVAATRRYSTTAQRSFAFSMSYAVMNIGFYVAAVIFDLVRGHLGEHGHYTLPGTAITLSTYRTLFLISFLVQLLLFPILYFGIRAGAEATDDGMQIVPEEPKYPTRPWFEALCLIVRDTIVETGRIFAGLWRQPGFYKFLAFLGFAAFMRLIFVHTTYTYPKFAIRELGQGAPVAQLSGVNNLLIVFLVPIVGALTARVSAYKMVMIGSVIGAASVYIMVMPPESFVGLANGWLGHFVHDWYLRLSGPVNPWYVSIFLFIVILSIGESIYSPRLYEYAAAIAPKGQEGSYMALSYLPFFLAKLCVTTFSGVLLQKYCPETGPRQSNTLWLIIALTTTIAPIGLIALRSKIRVHEAGREM
jgi:MFS family permease